jgi:hypothetical protein
VLITSYIGNLKELEAQKAIDDKPKPKRSESPKEPVIPEEASKSPAKPKREIPPGPLPDDFPGFPKVRSREEVATLREYNLLKYKARSSSSEPTDPIKALAFAKKRQSQ